MTEQFPTNPVLIDPTALAEQIQSQQDEIRELAEGRVQTTPMVVTEAASELHSFGLEADTFDVYGDTELVFGGGFKKFVSKEDPADVRIGYTKPHVGGNIGNPNRYLYNVMLHANGDISGKVSKESPTGTEYSESHYAATATEPEAVKNYQRQLSIMHDDAKYMAKLKQGGNASAARETAQVPVSKSRIQRALGRFSIR